MRLREAAPLTPRAELFGSGCGGASTTGNNAAADPGAALSLLGAAAVSVAAPDFLRLAVSVAEEVFVRGGGDRGEATPLVEGRAGGLAAVASGVPRGFAADRPLLVPSDSAAVDRRAATAGISVRRGNAEGEEVLQYVWEKEAVTPQTPTA